MTDKPIVFGFSCLLAFVVMGLVSVSKVETNRNKEVQGCIMDQIEIHEENRDSYLPRQRVELLHGFIVDCIKDPGSIQKEEITERKNMFGERFVKDKK